MQKRILMVSYHTCPLAFQEGKETGGMNVYVFELSRHLTHLGYQVDVITRCQDKKNEKVVEVEKGFRVIHLIAGPHKTVPKKELIHYIPEFVQSFQSFLTEEKISYDLIHAHYYQSGLIAQKILSLFSSPPPFLMTFHTLALMKNLVARSASELDSKARVEAEFMLMKTADAIIAPSVSDKQYMHYLYEVPEKKIFEIPPGVNTSVFKPMEKSGAKKKLNIPDTEKIILFVGRIEPLKGIDMLLYALKILHNRLPHERLKLLIIGGDVSQHIAKWSPLLKQLNTLRELLQLEESVEFIGQRSQNELVYYYNSAEMVVMPSHYESFGMAAAEAMSCGTPVITTNVTGISSLIDESRTALITTVNNPLLLASQMKRLLTDKMLYQETSKNSLEYVLALAWEKVAQQVKEIYEMFTKVIQERQQ